MKKRGLLGVVLIHALLLHGCGGVAKNGDITPMSPAAVTRAELALFAPADPASADFSSDAAVLQTLRRAAEQGNPVAQTCLGDRYRDGQGMPSDEVQAAIWYRRAAEQGYNVAQLKLGFAYQMGTGVAMDAAEGLRWYRRAAAQGNALAQVSVFAYEGAKAATADEILARREGLTQASRITDQREQAGIAQSAVFLPDMIPGLSDITQLSPLLGKEEDLAASEAKLADKYATGTGLARDPVKASYWRNKATADRTRPSKKPSASLNTNGLNTNG